MARAGPVRGPQLAAVLALHAELRAIVDGYVQAFEAADVPALAAMLADDATMAMPPLREWFAGRDAIATFFEPPRLDGSRRLVPTRANGQPAAAHYVWDAEAQAYLAHAIHVLGLRGDRIRDITVFHAPEMFDRFGLPERIEKD